jgi:hypothetical protein
MDVDPKGPGKLKMNPLLSAYLREERIHESSK